MLEPSALSDRYAVRPLGPGDADSVLALCRENTQFYEYCQAEPTREQVLDDMRLRPPGVAPSDKYYLGFYDGDVLAAVMDVVDGYPEPDIAFIGFFMMRRALQGRGLGSAIVARAAEALRETGKTALRLAIDRDNPQSNHFWRKNGFRVIREVEREGWTVLVAQRDLAPRDNHSNPL